MAWAKVDDNAPNHPKVLEAGAAGFGFFIGSLCYANRLLTDGFISVRALPLVLPGTPRGQQIRLAERLVQCGLWEKREDGWQIHDYHQYNDDREAVLERAARIRHLRSIAGQAGARARRNEPIKQSGSKAVATVKQSGSKAVATAVANGAGDDAAVLKKQNSKEVAPSHSPSRFIEFYELYPRKREPRAAERAWRAALKRAPAEEILAGLRRQLPELRQRERKYVPYPATWLNGDGWRSEPDGTGDPYDGFPQLYDCATCGAAHETPGCSR